MLESIKIETEEKLKVLQDKMADVYPNDQSFTDKICVYACGSMGRLEMTDKSDLDMFFIGMDENAEEKFECPNLEKYIFFGNLYKINDELNYKQPSKHGVYWDFISQKDMLEVGSRREDYINSFTARLLLILESKPLYNMEAYDRLIDSILRETYFRDYEKHSDEFYPLFLMNDIQKYWYTLMLNYEYRRNGNKSDNKRYWKRLKLKYARLITCYSMLACLFENNISQKYVVECIKMTPIERLDMLGTKHADMKTVVNEIKTKYEWFLQLRKQDENWWSQGTNKDDAFINADEFHDIVFSKFMKGISKKNPKLRAKMDIY